MEAMVQCHGTTLSAKKSQNYLQEFEGASHWVLGKGFLIISSTEKITEMQIYFMKELTKWLWVIM